MNFVGNFHNLALDAVRDFDDAGQVAVTNASEFR
jgi:hypothetical protein